MRRIRRSLLGAVVALALMLPLGQVALAGGSPDTAGRPAPTMTASADPDDGGFGP